MSRSALRTRVAGADARLAEVLRPYWERRVEDGSRRMDVVRTRLEGAVIRNLHEGTPSLDRLAETLDTSRASLAREIAAAGGMRLLVDTVRRRLAEEFTACFARESARKPESAAARAVRSGIADRIAANVLDSDPGRAF